jgi:hypothetical protein
MTSFSMLSKFNLFYIMFLLQSYQKLNMMTGEWWFFVLCKMVIILNATRFASASTWLSKVLTRHAQQCCLWLVNTIHRPTRIKPLKIRSLAFLWRMWYWGLWYSIFKTCVEIGMEQPPKALFVQNIIMLWKAWKIDINWFWLV